MQPSQYISPPHGNPTDKQRHEMIYESLVQAGRPEDYEYIIGNMNPPPDITTFAAPGQYNGIRVAVVGAGVAGMAVAFELRKLGLDITILEADEQRIGGRIHTHYFDAANKYYGELGAARIPATHETTWHYINLLNLNTIRIPEVSGTYVCVRCVRSRNNAAEIMEKIYPMFELTPAERETPWPELYTNVLESAIKSLKPEVRAEILQIKPEYSPELLRVVAISVSQALRDAGLSDAAVDMITCLSPTVNAFITGSFYTEFITQYALAFRDLYRIDGGMVNLPLAFYRSLTSDDPREYNLPKSALGSVTWKMGCWVSDCTKSVNDRKVILKYLTRQAPGGIQEAFDYVVFAVSLPALRKLNVIPAFNRLRMRAFREAFYIDAQKTLFLCRERFWEKLGIYGGTTQSDMVIQSVMYPPDHSECGKSNTGAGFNCSPDEPGVLTASYNLGNDAIRLGNARTFRLPLIKRQVEEVHGLPENYLDSIVVDHITADWNRNQWVTGAFLNLLPGQGARFGFELSRPDYDNTVYFAGEGLYPPHGWIQSSLHSAMVTSNGLAIYLNSLNH